MTRFAEWSALGAAVLIAYAYAGYPACLWLVGRFRRAPSRPAPPAAGDWPVVTLTVPVFNEEAAIRPALDGLLQLDYPHDRLQVLVISDASTDRTDQIVKEFSPRVELIRLPQRGGKTAAENAAVPYVRGEIVVNIDATIRVPPPALKRLVAWFQDPGVGVASGRDISATDADLASNRGESGYVGYEMWVRRQETRVEGIVGASGCFYGIRMELHRHPVPATLSRDFAAPLVARENGYRAVSAHDAVCFVPSTPSLRTEYRRKVRTMTRGLATLFRKRHLLNPVRYGWFAWMLFSHKLARWLVPFAVLAAASSVFWLARTHLWARWVAGGLMAIAVTAAIGWLVPGVAGASRLISWPSYVVGGLVAGLHAWLRALRGESSSVWEPTRRRAVRVE